MSTETKLGERKLLVLLAAVQFVNVLDFMMVMPLGPDFARDLGIPTSALGLVGGSYTLAAALSGIAGATFLDRFDRRRALFGALIGLAFATAAGGLAFDLPSLLAARVAAGMFGGPATALSLAIIADVIPIERRGRAMGAVMGAFSLASVLGVPAGLELAELGGWKLPFFAVAALGIVIALIAYSAMPPLRSHLEARATQRSDTSALAFLTRPTVALSLTATALGSMSAFILIPNISTYLQLNLGYPRERLGLLYLIGGVLTFFSTGLSGALTDKLGPARTATIGSVLYVFVLYSGFAAPTPFLPAVAIFALFMVTNTFRFAPMQALSSRVPNGPERARFMSAQQAVQHLASALGAMLSAQALGTDARGALTGISQVGWLSIGLAGALPFLLYAVQSRVSAPRELAQAA